MQPIPNILIILFLLLAMTACDANDHSSYSTQEIIIEEETDEPAETAIEPTAAGPDTSQLLTNLKAFTRAYGIVRFYHPADGVKEMNWDTLALSGVQFTQCAVDNDDLIFRLNALFQSFAPTINVYRTGEEPFIHPALTLPESANELEVIKWEHQGLGGLGSTNLYTSKRVTEALPQDNFPQGFYSPEDGYQEEIAPGISIFVPVSLFTDGEYTMPIADETAPIFVSENCISDQVSKHLADVVIAWNYLQHSYPSFDQTDADWHLVLEKTILETLTFEEEEAFLTILRQMIAELDDGQAEVNNPSIHDVFVPRIQLGWVEDQIVVLEVNTSALEGIQPGDIVVGIGTEPLEDMIHHQTSSISGATEQWIRERMLTELLRGESDTSVLLKIDTQSNGVRSFLAERNLLFTSYAPSSQSKFVEIEPGIFFIDTTRMTEEEFNEVIPQLQTAEGIIFDVRGATQLPYSILGHFINEPIKSLQFHIPQSTLPDQAEVDWNIQTFEIDPFEPKLDANLVFLVDGQTSGYSEIFVNLAAWHELGAVIGTPTAGTAGNRNLLITPGGYEITWTGLKTLFQDGGQFHGVGVQPELIIERSIDAIREGQDELIEKALEILR